MPTWEALEASRTYASDFEGQRKAQLLRVPFVRGAQERLESGSAGAIASGQASSELPADPWGLERRGDGLQELQPEVNSGNIEKQRHVWLLSEASRFFQTYDAFCRVAH